MARALRAWGAIPVRRLALPAVLALAGCTHSALTDCPEQGVLGQDVHRWRTMEYRTRLGDPPAAAQRFVQYAALAALAYRDAPRCHAAPADQPMAAGEAQRLSALLAPRAGEAPWRQLSMGHLGLPDACEDDTGLAMQVWQRTGAPGQPDDVAIAFRGTSNFKDWPYGNLWWFSRFFLRDNQYSRAARHARAAVQELAAAARQAGKPFPRIVATGHSLGGGLAQHVLYAMPQDILQAVVFDPSAVTGFVATDSDEATLGCSCGEQLGVESRILRIYESDEILANLRIFHKVFFPPHPHIQEVRFALDQGKDPVAAHNMRRLALELATLGQGGAVTPRWWVSDDASCTAKVEQAQVRMCAGRRFACVRTAP